MRYASMAAVAMPALAPATSGHPVAGSGAPAGQKAGQHRFHRAADLRPHADSGRSQSRLQGPGDRPADQHVDTQRPELRHPIQGILPRDDDITAPELPAVFRFHDQEPTTDIEHR